MRPLFNEEARVWSSALNTEQEPINASSPSVSTGSAAT
jgi:hypothetical protein